jgi:hypothetical protein
MKTLFFTFSTTFKIRHVRCGWYFFQMHVPKILETTESYKVQSCLCGSTSTEFIIHLMLRFRKRYFRGYRKEKMSELLISSRHS